MSDYGRLQDERDALAAENETLRARVAELESAVQPNADDTFAVEAEPTASPPCGCLATDVRSPDGKKECVLDAGGTLLNNAYCENRSSGVPPAAEPQPEPEGFAAMPAAADEIAEREPTDWDAVHRAETDKVIAEAQPNG